jgi:tol-pal system protein YbgF
MATAKPEEYDAYRKAYDKLKAQDFGGSIKAFNSFLATYPNSTLAGNAYYWLGKAYLQPPQDAAKAQQAFGKVSGDLPQHAKAPDALYELGKIAYAKGDKAKAKSLMQQVIDNYGTSGSTAPQLAKQFLDQNFKG